MDSRNVTLHLPTDLIRKTKAQAAERGKSLNAFIREVLEETVSSKNRTRKAIARLLELAEQGPYFPGDPRSITRDELHERR